MTPLARNIVNSVAEEFQLDPAAIVGRRRKHMHARIAIARRLAGELGYSSPKIGKILNRDRSTITYYLGRIVKRKPSAPYAGEERY